MAAVGNYEIVEHHSGSMSAKLPYTYSITLPPGKVGLSAGFYESSVGYLSPYRRRITPNADGTVWTIDTSSSVESGTYSVDAFVVCAEMG